MELAEVVAALQDALMNWLPVHQQLDQSTWLYLFVSWTRCSNVATEHSLLQYASDVDVLASMIGS